MILEKKLVCWAAPTRILTTRKQAKCREWSWLENGHSPRGNIEQLNVNGKLMCGATKSVSAPRSCVAKRLPTNLPQVTQRAATN